MNHREAGGRCDVVVIGSGLAGLTAAATARRAGATVTVIDGPTTGGRARTDERDGFLLNLGPHAVFDRGPGRAVLDRLGVAVHGVAPPGPPVLAWRDRTAVAPQGLGALTSSFLGARDKARLGWALARISRTDPASVAHLTVAEWLAGLVPAEAPREVLATLVRIGTYTADADRLSADVAVQQAHAAARGVTYLHGGWAQLTEGLRRAGDGAEHRTGSVTAVEPGPDGPTVRTTEGAIGARCVVVATGSPASVGGLLPSGAPDEWSRLGPPVTASCLDLGLRRVPATPAWFGVDRPHYLVAHAPSARLAPEGSALVHAMRNLHHDEPASPDELRADLHALARRAGIADDDVVLERYLHRMVVVTASVTPASGGLAGRPGIESSGVDGVLVAGDWVGPSGWLADASLASGEAAGRRAAERARAHSPAGGRAGLGAAR